jgi:putative ABC transport system permease protein
VRLIRRVLSFVRSRDRDLREEIESHLAEAAEEYARRGLSPIDSMAAARRDFGGVLQARDAHRDLRRGSFVNELDKCMRDMRHALRDIRRHWRFYLLTSCVLGIGVGATATMLALMHFVLLRPPAGVVDPSRLVVVPTPDGQFTDYAALRSRLHSLDLAAYRRRAVSIGTGRTAYEGVIECVTSDYFGVLGSTAASGRLLGGADAGTRAGSAAVISPSLQSRRFAGAVDVLGQPLAMGGKTFTVVGVAQPAFTGLRLDAPDAWISLEGSPDVCTSHGSLVGGSASVTTIGRIRSAFTRQQAAAEASTFSPSSGSSTRVGPGHAYIELESVEQARVASVRGLVRVLWWLTAGAVCLLLIVCSNVAGLVHLRLLERRRDFAVQLQLGATRLRLCRELAAEQLQVVAAAAFIGLLTAWWLTRMATTYLPFSVPVALDLRAFLAITGLAAVAAIVSSIVPVCNTARLGIGAVLRQNQTTSTARSIAANALLVVQATVAFALIGVGVLMLRSVSLMWSQTGYDINNIVAISVDLQRSGYRPDAEVMRFFQDLRSRVERVPGVERTGLSSSGILGGPPDQVFIGLRSGPGGAQGYAGMAAPEAQAVSPDYFSTVGTRLLSGRSFGALDNDTSRAVTIVDAELAKQYWPRGDAVGNCAYLGHQPGCVEVVGITESRRYKWLRVTSPEVFVPLAQAGRYRFSYLHPRVVLARTSGDPERLIGRITEAVYSSDAETPAIQIGSLSTFAGDQARSTRLAAQLLGVFGFSGALMAAVGLYAILAFAARRRGREMAVRVALGAPRAAVVVALCKSTMLLVAAGCVAGTVIVFIAAHLLKWLTFGIAPLDPPTVVVSAAILLGAALAGGTVPSYRILHASPALLLKHD